MTYRWPEGDDSYMKLLLAQKADGSRFRVLISRFHPIGDFDGPGAAIPAEPARIYRTAHGFRVFFTGRYGEPPGTFLHGLVDSGLDPLYAKICRERGYYAVRVDPKNTGIPGCVASLVSQEGGVHPAWNELISVHDGMTGALSRGEFLV